MPKSRLDEMEVASPVAAPAPQPGLRQALYERLIASIETEGAAEFRNPATTRSRVRRLLDEGLGGRERLSKGERERLEDELVYEIGGLGPLGPLMADPSVSDILVNGAHEVWVDRHGRLERTDVRFDDEAHLRRLLDRLVASQGRHIDDASPMVDSRLSDGSRLHGVIPPLSSRGTVVSIRRFREIPFRMQELVENGTLNGEMGKLLGAAVEGRLNLLISGGASAGKTTLLNVLSGFISHDERVVTIEETRELRLAHPHVVSLEARMPNVEGRGEVSLRALVKNALRMRADRIIVGEVRGAEVFDMLQAMNIGHDGSLTTVHANSPEDALRRLEGLILMGGIEMPSRGIRELLGTAIHLVAHLTRFGDGNRRITSVREVVFENRELTTREMFRFERDSTKGSASGRHVDTGHRPEFLLEILGEDAAGARRVPAAPVAPTRPLARPAPPPPSGEEGGEELDPLAATRIAATETTVIQRAPVETSSLDDNPFDTDDGKGL